VFPLKRKLFSALWRLKQATVEGYNITLIRLVEILTERYWLIDYLPTVTKKRTGVLLIRLDLIGDFVLWLDSAKAYRQLYPNQKITLAVNSSCVELAKALPYWDEVIGINVTALRTNHLYRLCELVKLRWQSFSIAIQPTFSREFVGDLVLRASGAFERIGYEGDCNNILISIKNKTDAWYTRLITNDTKQLMELNINAHFVRRLGLADFLSDVPFITKIISDTKLSLKPPYIVVAPSASWNPKMWAIQNFAALIKQLTVQYELQIVICGGPDDLVVCDKLASLVESHSKVINIAGKTTLPQLLEVIRNAKILITNDSAPVHIAAATGTPAICVLGGGHFGRFLPYLTEHPMQARLPIVVSNPMNCYGCRWKCEYDISDLEAVPCIKDVSVAAVYEACTSALNPKQSVELG
jgi:ADP-heptose:LPS heptosyltransferase